MRSLFGNLHSPSSFSPLSGRPPGRSTRGSGLFWSLLCALAGGLQAASLAWPFAWGTSWLSAGQPSGVLQVFSLALLVWALRHVHRVGQGVWRAWVFATAWLAGTFWWLFISMHTYGGLAGWLSALAVFALAGALAMYYALAAGMLCAWAPRHRVLQAGLFASLWTMAELARGQWLTGFPWGAGGYAQVDAMAGFAPWVGVYGMGAISALLAYALAVIIPESLDGLYQRLVLPRNAQRLGRVPVARPSPTAFRLGLSLLGLVGLVTLALALALQPAWQETGREATADAGPLKVWLLQGNVPQDEKFEPGTGVLKAMSWYPQQIALAAKSPDAPDIVVASETALPLLPQQFSPIMWAGLMAETAKPAKGMSVMVGLPMGSYESGYTNSVLGLTPEGAKAFARRLPMEATQPELAKVFDDRTAGFYRYDKHHLVPFGEFIPPLFRWFTDLMHIPLGDFDRGALVQPSMLVAGQRLAPNICYEDLFGEELAALLVQDEQSSPTVLVNLSNIGWFGDSVAIDQHLQISRMRARELGRPMLRATNTGATAAIDHTGVVTAAMPRLTEGHVEAEIRGRSGLTPFAQWAGRYGQLPLWGVCLLVMVLSARLRRRSRRQRRTGS